MSSRFAACLCLIGAAACSQNNPEPPSTADDVNQSNVASSDAAMTPASLEANRPDTTGPTTTPTPAAASGNDGSNGASAPLAPEPKRSSTSSATPSTTNPPPSTTSPSTQPDNTKVNQRDTNSATATPPDQKENESDLKITQHVRQAVMADDSLSFTAKNVKIIAQNGKITLRGPVKTSQERAAIEAAARKVAGVTQVDNQIEVKK
jgi:hyperosmotically inducible periplasmic protein